jgi:hypothetical protein
VAAEPIVSSNARTRAARTAEGKCTVCLQRKATPGHSTCAECRGEINSYTKNLYNSRRDRGECVRCRKRTGKHGKHGDRRDPMLCDEDGAARRKERADIKTPKGGSPATDILPRPARRRRRP